MDEKPVKLVVYVDELAVDSDLGSTTAETGWLLASKKEDRAVEPAGGKLSAPCEQALGVVQLAVATFFCLMWNIAGVLITLHFCKSSEKDKARLLAVALTSVPILGMGSLLMWFVLCEWCNQVVILRRRAWSIPAGDIP